MKKELKLAGLLPKLAENMKAAITAKIAELHMIPETTLVKRAEVEVKAEPASTEDDNRTIEIVAMTRDLDRDNEVIFPDGMDVTEFEMSPKILDGHDFSKPPVAKATKVVKSDKSINMMIEFAPTPEGEKFRVLSKFMPLTFSVGFITLEKLWSNEGGFGDLAQSLAAKWPEFKAVADKVQAFILKSLLLEVSIVSVPANIQAIQKNAAAALKAGKLTPEQCQFVIKSFAGDPEPGEGDKKITTSTPAPPPEPEEKKVTARKVPLKATKIVRAKLYKPVAKLYHKPLQGNDLNEAIATSVKNAVALHTGKV